MQRRIRQVTGNNMGQEFGRGRHSGAAGSLLWSSRNHVVQPQAMTEILFEQHLKVLRCQLPEETIKTIGECSAREPRGRRALLERKFAKRKIRVEPLVSRQAQKVYQALRFPGREVTLAIA